MWKPNYENHFAALLLQHNFSEIIFAMRRTKACCVFEGKDREKRWDAQGKVPAAENTTIIRSVREEVCFVHIQGRKPTPFLFWIRKGFNSLVCPFRLKTIAYINLKTGKKKKSACAKRIKPFFKGFLNGNLSTGEKWGGRNYICHQRIHPSKNV